MDLIYKKIYSAPELSVWAQDDVIATSGESVQYTKKHNGNSYKWGDIFGK